MAAFTNRYEIKYLVQSRRAPEILAGIQGFLARDENGDAEGGYYVHSVYFDSPTYDFYTEKREGELARIKPRVRLYRDYPDGDPTGAFLELKGRYDRIVAKRRVSLSLEQADSLVSGNGRCDGLDHNHSVVGEFRYLSDRLNLKPSVAIHYHRTAYDAAFYHNVRITFDRLVQCSLATALDSPQGAFLPALPPNWFVIELKYNEQVPNMLLNRLKSLGLKQWTLSKYAIGMEQGWDHLRRPSQMVGDAGTW